MNTQSRQIDWQALFFDPRTNWSGRIRKLAIRRLGDTADAESAYNFALESVSTDDWRRLREGYRGLGSPEGFLGVTITRLIDDYAVGKYGRKRPPKWVQDLGGYWNLVFRLVCIKRLEPETVVDMVCARGEHSEAEVRYAIAQVRSRITGCGERYGEMSQAPDELEQDGAGGRSPAAELEADEAGTVLEVLSGMLGNPEADRDDETQAESLSARLAALRQKLRLTDTERLLLRLVYQDGFSIARAARSLGIHEQKTRRLHKALLKRLRAGLAAAGIA